LITDIVSFPGLRPQLAFCFFSTGFLHSLFFSLFFFVLKKTPATSQPFPCGGPREVPLEVRPVLSDTRLTAYSVFSPALPKVQAGWMDLAPTPSPGDGGGPSEATPLLLLASVAIALRPWWRVCALLVLPHFRGISTC